MAAPQKPICDFSEALGVRKRIGNSWRIVHEKLLVEITEFTRKKLPLPEELVRNFKIASDQLRLDYRLDHIDAPAPLAIGEPSEAALETPADELTADIADPLAGLKLYTPPVAASKPHKKSSGKQRRRGAG